MQRIEREVRKLLDPIAPADVSPQFVGWLSAWLSKISTLSALAKAELAETKSIKMEIRRQQMYYAVKEAEQTVDNWWRYLGHDESLRMIRERPPGSMHPLYAAKAAARAAARADLRARWAAEDAAAKQVVELPSHIMRLNQ
jgi:hypothetical protein